MTQKQINKLFKNHIKVDFLMVNVYVFFTKEYFMEACKVRNDEEKELSLGVAKQSTLINADNGEENTIFMIGIFHEADEVIVHECVHIAHMILKYIGHKADFDNDEVEAHLVQKLFYDIKKLKK